MELYRQQGKGVLPSFTPDSKLRDPALYFPSEALKDAVNVALLLGQPLLLTGEPGTGKTQLAFHVAYFFNLGEPLIFNAQTSSKAQDLFYSYDALGHFQYNQNFKEVLTTEQVENRFIRYNALGEAIRRNKRQVVLIDEIDKAPRDLPNDILYAIEDLSFGVSEIDQKFETDHANRPVIIITSNSEKNLPDAFMRRVIYHHIDFPNPESLLYILNQKTEGIRDRELQELIAHFLKIRNLNLKKPPSTAELIYWAFYLKRTQFPIFKINSMLEFEERTALLTSYSILVKNKEDLDLINSR